MKLKSTLALILVATGLGGFACSSDEESKGTGGGNNELGECVPTADECYGAGPTGPGSECLAKTDNSQRDIWTGRFSYLKINKPAALANDVVQELVIDKGIALNQPACEETGDGTFSWLLQFDSANNKLRTGGGDPVTDPKAGACFVTLPNANPALSVSPVEVDVSVDADGKFAASIDSVVVPIFLDVAKSNVILLPLHAIDFAGSFSEDRNCIGHSNLDKFRAQNLCMPESRAEGKWTTGGTLKGYITIEEAEEVVIDTLSVTLCGQIAGSKWQAKADGSDIKACAETDAWKAGERPEGDWCSTTNGPATPDCKDAWQLEGGFAASAIEISGDCK